MTYELPPARYIGTYAGIYQQYLSASSTRSALGALLIAFKERALHAIAFLCARAGAARDFPPLP